MKEARGAALAAARFNIHGNFTFWKTDCVSSQDEQVEHMICARRLKDEANSSTDRRASKDVTSKDQEEDDAGHRLGNGSTQEPLPGDQTDVDCYVCQKRGERG